MRTRKSIVVLRGDQELFRLSKGVELSERLLNAMLELWKTDNDRTDTFNFSDEQGNKEWYGLILGGQSWIRINNRFRWDDWFDFDD